MSEADPNCTICGRPKGLFHAEVSHSFAKRRQLVQSRRNSEKLIHELLHIFPDLASIHKPGCRLKKKSE